MPSHGFSWWWPACGKSWPVAGDSGACVQLGLQPAGLCNPEFSTEGHTERSL